VVETGIDDERLGRAVADGVELSPLVPAFVDEDEHAAVGAEKQSLDRPLELGDLVEVATVRRQREQLPRAREVGSDEERLTGRRPRQRIRLAELEEVSEARQGSRRRARG
jgi:hypothetical protein